MDFTLMIPREDYTDEELAADNPKPHSHFCLNCATEWSAGNNQETTATWMNVPNAITAYLMKVKNYEPVVSTRPYCWGCKSQK